mmetsp:Transcript_6068/g.20417  ORF Transcript_6068/g.20417 Transcript_6068/m.20417 type:complete len:300 (-) Transcript_6068:319-1218(-)
MSTSSGSAGAGAGAGALASAGTAAATGAATASAEMVSSSVLTASVAASLMFLSSAARRSACRAEVGAALEIMEEYSSSAPAVGDAGGEKSSPASRADLKCSAMGMGASNSIVSGLSLYISSRTLSSSRPSSAGSTMDTHPTWSSLRTLTRTTPRTVMGSASACSTVPAAAVNTTRLLLSTEAVASAPASRTTVKCRLPSKRVRMTKPVSEWMLHQPFTGAVRRARRPCTSATSTTVPFSSICTTAEFWSLLSRTVQPATPATTYARDISGPPMYVGPDVGAFISMADKAEVWPRTAPVL